jgi:DNA-binding beta-propeller fold protein YncE
VGVTAVAGTRRIPLLAAAVAALTLIALVAGSSAARAAELVYWDNYRDEPATIAFSNTDGSGGGALNLAGVEIIQPEGMAYDPVTNRLYIANEGPAGSEGEIAYVNLDGSGAGVFTAPGAPIKAPEGIAIDPVTRMMYWANTKTGEGSIARAKLDGSEGGTLNVTGAQASSPYRLALDPAGGRVYWSNFVAGVGTFQYANVNNSGGGELALTPAPENVYGLAADPTSGRLYVLNSETPPTLVFTGLNGGAASPISLGTANREGFGLAVDPVLGKAYWGNYANEKTATDAIGFTTLSGTTGTITPAVAPVNGPQDPVIIKSPSGSGAPQLTQSKAQLSCSQGSWGADFPGSSVYQSPRSYAYQWALNGAPVAGATGPTLTATTAGAYACTVTATNQAGSASQSSSTAATVTKAKFKLVAKKKKAKSKPGKLATFKVQALNQGDLSAKSAKLCLKVPTKAKKALKASKCKSLKPLAAGGKVLATLKVRVKPTAAPKSYKLKITLPGTKAAKVTLKVLG